jgi:mono/diheme cytochrome c family protein
MPKNHRKSARAALVATSCLASLLAVRQARAANSDPGLLEHGKYLTDAGDCQACHTAPGGKPFAGGLYMNTPFGPISTPNITPDRDTGIGKITDDQFVRVFHQGIGMEGEHLYPVMPFPWYTKVTRDDALAIKAYLFSLPPEHAPRKPLKLAFPFNIRAALIGWDAVFLKTGVFKPDPKQSAEVNRGAYLVQGLAHCGECHNGNNMLGDTDMAASLRGGPIDKWYAPNITSDKSQGIGRYTDEQIFTYLKTGHQKDMGVVVGPMAQTMHESLGKLTDSDLHDIVYYLKSTPPKEGFKKREPVAGSQQVAANGQAYLNYCASCHLQNGQGLAGAVPKLAGNGVVTAQGPETVIRVILGGINAQGSYSAMPAIGVSMTDQEVADATNYVRAAWGNAAPAQAGPGQVGSLRRETTTLLAMNLPGGCPKIAEDDTGRVIAQPDVQKILAATTQENVLANAETLIQKVRAGAPKASQADIINSLTIGYCPVVMADSTLTTPAQRSQALDGFSERVYTDIAANGQDTTPAK